MLPDPSQCDAIRRYRAFLLRLWQESPGQPWRASLQDAGTDERHGFPDLDQLLDFLHTQTGPKARPGPRWRKADGA
jgi:hypothetical protein